MNLKTAITLFAFLLIIPKVEAQKVYPLRLKQAFKYEDNKCVPTFSGLTIKDGTLYSINDHGTNSLYKLNINTIDSTFIADGPGISEYKDFEGICYFNNSFFAIEEKECKVYKVVGDTVESYSKEFLTSLNSRKLIDTGDGNNKQIESFAMLTDSIFLIATERDITTLAKINIEGKILSKKRILPLNYDNRYLPDALTRRTNNDRNSYTKSNSFSDLCIYKGKAYLLERQRKMIHIINISDDSYTIDKTMSFKNGIEEYEEDNPYYGTAEGIAVDDQYIYLILDNNGHNQDNRSRMRDETRRTLFQFHKDNF